ncbi:MAG: iron chelate uptake ABC transporter family permease subunit, partial [Paraclostridium sp.]
MQASSVNKLPNKKDNKIKFTIDKENKQKRTMYILGLMIIVFAALYLTVGVNMDHLDYAMKQRIPRLMAIVLTGGCIAFSSMIFQTITNNNILTPSVLGLDSLYILVQTIIVFMLGVDSKFITSKNYNFVLCVMVMVIASFILYKKLFERSGNNIFFLLLVGMIFGT